MATVYSGAVPGGNNTALAALGDLLQGGMLGYQKAKDDAQTRADKEREFDQKQQELDATKDNTKLLRQQQMWDSIAQGAQRAKDNAIKLWITTHPGMTSDDAIRAGVGEQEFKSYIATSSGYPSGAGDDAAIKDITDRLGPGAAEWFKSNSKTTATADAARKVPADVAAPGNTSGNALAAAQKNQQNPYGSVLGATGLAAGGFGGLYGLSKIPGLLNSPLGQAIGKDITTPLGRNAFGDMLSSLKAQGILQSGEDLAGAASKSIGAGIGGAGGFLDPALLPLMMAPAAGRAIGNALPVNNAFGNAVGGMMQSAQNNPDMQALASLMAMRGGIQGYGGPNQAQQYQGQ